MAKVTDRDHHSEAHGRAARGPGYEGLEAQARRLAEGAVTSVELTEAALAWLEATEGSLNAFRIVRAQAARREAEDADRRIAAGRAAPLLGVPVAVKDDTDVAGEPTAFGCAGDFPLRRADSEVVRRLRQAGAVIIGKTNTPELGQWPFTEGSAFGATRNPWSLAHSPGGSSGGSAVAVTSGVVAGALGSDGAGSVRIPAAWTNLVGIKARRGRVSTWPDAEGFYGLTSHGTLARSVADAAALLDAVSGLHPGDVHRAPPLAAPLRSAVGADPGRLRIAVSTRIPFSLATATLDPEIRAAVERLAQVLAGCGHDVVEADPAYGLIGTTFVPRSHVGLRDWARRVPDVDLLDRRTKSHCRTGDRLDGAVLRWALRSEAGFARRLGAIFADVDVVLTPTTAQPPLAIGACAGRSSWKTEQVIIGACPYAWPWNVVGWPALNVPAGFTGDGLPVGAQLLGPADAELRLVALAAELEGIEGWADHTPPFPIPIPARSA